MERGPLLGDGEDKFAERVRAWLDDDHGKLRRWYRALAGIYHNRVPRRFRPVPALHWVAKGAVAASAPFIALYYGVIPALTAYVVAACLFASHTLVDALGAVAKRRAPPDESEAIVRFGDLLSAFKSRSIAPARRDDAVTACLGILEIYGLRITKVAKGNLSVSLVQYVGSSSTRMIIKHRNPGNLRPIGREFDGANLLGHHACKEGALPRVVHSLAHFGKGLQSPTQSKVDYKSMLFIPIAGNGGGEGQSKVRAFVSIDCKRPYAFYGNRSSEIVVTCSPVIKLLTDLLRERN